MPLLQRVQTIMDSLNEQVKTGHLCDVVFYNHSGSIWAHSCILEGFSPFFSQLFSNRSLNGHHWSIKQPFQISVSNITRCKSTSKNSCMQCLTQVVRYIYTGQIKPNLVHLQHLFILCDRLKSEELTRVCENFQREHSLLNVSKKCELEAKANEASSLLNNRSSAGIMSPENKNSTRDQTVSSLKQICNGTSDGHSGPDCRSATIPCGFRSNSECENLVECKLCSFVSVDQNLIKMHSKAFHSSLYNCIYCSFSHKNVAMLVDHIEAHCSSREINLICSVCLFEGQDFNDLVSHAKTHLSPKPFNCITCKRGFERRSLWLKHSRSHIFKKTFVCSACPLKFNTDMERYKHFKLIHAPKKHFCDECGFVAPFPSVLESHRLKHRNKLSCKEGGCDFQTSSEIMLLRHKSVHKSVVVSRVEKSNECPVCSMKFTLSKNLARHMRTHKPQQGKLKCRLCSYETFRSDKYNEHVSNKHNDPKQVSSSKLTSSCKSSKRETANSASGEQGTVEDKPECVDKSSTDTSSIKHLRDGYNVESPFSPKHNTLMMNDEGDISIVNSNEKNSVTLRNIGNLTGTITLDERTGVLTMNNINSGSVFLNETTGELTYINLENDKNIDLNCFNQESVKQIDSFKTPPISNPNRTSEVTKLDEFTGEIIKVSTSNEDNFMPEQEFDSFDMDVNDESLDGFDDFDELLFDVFNEEDGKLDREVVLQNGSSLSLHSYAMPHLDESTGLLTFDETLAPAPKSEEIWSGSYQPVEKREMNDSEAYQLLLDEVTGVLHD